MPKSPVPLQDIRDYLTLEDTEGLVAGSVRYVGAVSIDATVRHYWSYPLNGELRWVCMDGESLADDKVSGGKGPCRFFLLELARNRVAMLECEQRFPDRVNFYLPEEPRRMRQGIVEWEDYDQVMNPLGVPLERAFRQGGLIWKHRKPTPEAEQRTRDHYRRMWLPPN